LIESLRFILDKQAVANLCFVLSSLPFSDQEPGELGRILRLLADARLRVEYFLKHGRDTSERRK
jgi:hypothetical protein